MIYDCCVRQKKCCSILKHVLKRCDNRKSCRKPVVSLSHAKKIVPCKSALRMQERVTSRSFETVITADSTNRGKCSINFKSQGFFFENSFYGQPDK